MGCWVDWYSKRASGFDMAPPGATVLPAATIPGVNSGLLHDGCHSINTMLRILHIFWS